MSDMLQTFLMIQMCLVKCTYQVLIPYQVFNQLVVVNMSEKNSSVFIRKCTPPFGMPRKPPSAHLKRKILSIDA